MFKFVSGNQKMTNMAKSDNHLVIMAGGVGGRFWPMSTEERPKQFVDVLGVGSSLLQLTYKRFEGLFAPENIWVLTNRAYEALVREQLPMLPEENVRLEPCRKNTAPAVAYISWRIKKANPRANIVVTPSDYIVTDENEFRRVIMLTLQFTADTDAIVTLGMKPNRPETGYGYIKADLSMSSTRQKEIFRVDSFKEKPDAVTALKYIQDDAYFWNAGIFVWNVNTIVNAFRVYRPSMAKIFESMLEVYGSEQEAATLERRYAECESISVDYAIMEKAEEIYVCPANFGWSDLGTWGSLLLQSKQDLYGNSLIGKRIKMYDSHNCIVHTMQEKQVIIQGLDGYIVAEKDNALLICRLAEEQRIKDFSAED